MNNYGYCDKCGKLIVDAYGFTVCDTCEATVCMECVGQFNECPVCGKEVTLEENF